MSRGAPTVGRVAIDQPGAASPTAPLTRGQRRLLVVLVGGVTLNAFEALAVVTAMPAVADDLGGDALYGATFSAYMLANLVSMVVNGSLADRAGAGRAYRVGLVSFGAGLALGAAAPTMAVLVGARVLQGYGGGALATTAYMAIGRGFDPDQRPRAFAVLSSAWVVPGLVAPPLAGVVSDRLSWRLVFGGILPVIAVLAPVAGRPLRHLGPAEARRAGPDDRARAREAIVLAAGVAAVVGGLGADRPLLALAAVAAGSGPAAWALSRLLPPGTLRAAPGLPGTLVARSLLSMAFFGVDTFLPYAVDRVHGQGQLVAGLTVTSGTLTWTVGSWLQANRGERWRMTRAVSAAFGVVAVGTALVVPIAWSSVPIAVAVGGWMVAGLGMGIGVNSLSVAAVNAAQPGQEGTVGSWLGLADVLGFALAAGLGGAVVAGADRGDLTPTAAVAASFAIAGGWALAGVLVARRVAARPGPQGGLPAG